MTKKLDTKAFEQWLQEQAHVMVRYRQIEKSDILEEYKALKKVVESSEFQNKKKELTTTKYADRAEGKAMARYKKLKWNTSVILYNLFKKEAWKEKTEVAEYLALQAQINTAEFQQANAFWKNAKRWFTTPESEQEKRFSAFVKHEDIVFYLAHTEEEIAGIESYKLVWADEFENTKISEVWQSGFLYPSNEFKANHSHVGEQQAYTEGRNTKVANRVMSIVTKKQKVTAPAWHPTKGMIMHPFAYTSDVWHTAQAVAPTEGVIQVKMRCTGKAKYTVCLTNAKAGKSIAVLPEKLAKGYTIYSLVWDDKEIIHYVNNMEVSRAKNTLVGEPLHILMRGYLPANQRAGGGQMDIDWIRIYTNA